MNNCVYCENPDVQQREIARNDLARAIFTNIPITEGHALVMPIRCAAALADLSKPELLAIFALAEQIMAAQAKTFGATGFNCAWNQGQLAGQSVSHFHLHVIPRQAGDTGLLGYDPRSMIYRTGDREPLAESLLQEMTKKIKANLD